MASGSITVTSSNSSNILVSTVNPISNTSKNADWTYMLMPYVEDASSNIYNITIVNPSGITIYGCILGPGGLGGNYKNWQNGTYSAGGGGGGMGGFINFTFPNSTSSSGDEYKFTINSVGGNKSMISSSSVSIYAYPGKNGNDGSEDSTGSGGNGADCDSSDAVGIEQTGTYYGGGGGGSGAMDSDSGCSVSQGGTGGTGKTLDGESGLQGDDTGGNGGRGGTTTITFSDGTSYSETGGNGGAPFYNGISGPLSWAMIYYKSNSQTVTITSSSTEITPSITVTLTKIVSNDTDGVTGTQVKNTNSVSTLNPLTYYSGGFTYILVECPKCSYSSDDDVTYYVCNWTVPADGTTYYFATVGPGSPAGLHTTHHSGNPNYTGMSGGGGNGAFINGTLIPGSSYNYTMWNLSLNPIQSNDSSDTNDVDQTQSLTYNQLSKNTYLYNLSGAALPGYYYYKYVPPNAYSAPGGYDYGSANVKGGDGGDGMSYDTTQPDITSMLNHVIGNGGGGGGGGGAAIGGDQTTSGGDTTCDSGDGGSGGSGGSGGIKGTKGQIGAATRNTSWPLNADGGPGQSTYTFSDGSSCVVFAGSGGRGNGVSSGGDNDDLVQATSGVQTWMMIYYKS